jgi:heptosyltransferase-2
MPDWMGPDFRRVAVVQPLPGIGDMIWHLPHIRAVANWVGRKVTLVAKPRSAADQLFAGEQTIGEVLWLDRNPERRRGRHDGPAGFLGLTRALRRHGFDAAVLLHHSRTLAAALWAAGVPNRFGYGFGTQRWFLNRPPFLQPPQLTLHPHAQATAWLAAAGIPLEQPEPSLMIAPERRAAARERLGEPAGPFVALGIGTSEPYKQWGAERFSELGAALLDAGWRRLVLCGGPAEAGLAAAIQARLGERVCAATGWNLAELAALLAEAAFYVGNDTGVMNLAAAAGTRTYCLFGATPPFHHSSAIVPILPPDGRTDIATGMARITAPAVLAVLPERASVPA